MHQALSVILTLAPNNLCFQTLLFLCAVQFSLVNT